MDVMETPIFSWVLRLFVSSVLMMIVVTNSFARIGYDITTDTLVSVPVAIPDTAAGVGEVFYVVEEMPDFIYKDKHGIFAFHDYVQMQIKYPETEYEPGIQGKVYVSFIVEADGRRSTIRIKRSLYKSIDEGVIDIIAHAPRWIPGKQKGSPVRVTFTIPVTFKLQ